MKELFSKPGESIRLVDKERMIFKFGMVNYYDVAGYAVPVEDTFLYYDINGNAVPAEDSFYRDDDDLSYDPWNQDWIENEGIEEKLISESTTELECEIDDVFGNFGFKNKAGEFVIEPQFACAYEFTCGLACVNLNRTWYRTEDGCRFYENHFGYIDGYGKTVIPFIYDEARPFNKYGVAVVETLNDVLLIDTTGKTIPGTENLAFSHYYDYDDRFLEFTDKGANFNREPENGLPVGLYDTKERKVTLAPSIDAVIQYSEDEIHVYGRDGKQYYINSKGEKLYPWLNDKNFRFIERPNQSLVTIVGITKNIELAEKPSDDISVKEKKHKCVFLYGLYSPKEFFILPMEYEELYEIDHNIFACKKDGIYTLIALDENDY